MTGRRRALVAGSAAACIAVAGFAACTPESDRDARIDAEPAPAQQLSATCTPEGVEVSGTALAASPGGATFEVSSSAPARTYLIFDGDGWAGPGDPVPSTTETWSLPIPPGQVTLSCMRRGRTVGSATATVDLTDPGHYWRDTTLADAGCPGDVEPFWNWAGSGDTRGAAVDDLLAEMATPHRTFTGVERAEIGYVDASSQTWLVHSSGRIYMTASVHPRKLDAGVPDPAGGYAAYAGFLCQA